MINRLICDSNNLTHETRKNNRLHCIAYQIVKDLLFTELEIVYLALFLEKFGWEYDTSLKINSENFHNNNNIKFFNITFAENLFFTALFVKVKFYKLNFLIKSFKLNKKF